mmetsp:Transcript_146357/g.355209  ORF Transcript_146357/g.355209 Transcript_146357/m.355209 type:complete len:277 (-) Transcript_146357:895-1725(-)
MMICSFFLARRSSSMASRSSRWSSIRRYAAFILSAPLVRLSCWTLRTLLALSMRLCACSRFSSLFLAKSNSRCARTTSACFDFCSSRTSSSLRVASNRPRASSRMAARLAFMASRCLRSSPAAPRLASRYSFTRMSRAWKALVAAITLDAARTLRVCCSFSNCFSRLRPRCRSSSLRRSWARLMRASRSIIIFSRSANSLRRRMSSSFSLSSTFSTLSRAPLMRLLRTVSPSIAPLNTSYSSSPRCVLRFMRSFLASRPCSAAVSTTASFHKRRFS